MNKVAKELIEKLAGGRPGGTGANQYQRADGSGHPGSKGTHPSKALGTALLVGGGALAAGTAAAGYGAYRGAKALFGKKDKKEEEPVKDSEKKASMKSIIDDLVKGAQQNTFGRPVRIQQGFNPTPLEIAKYAGALTALNEEGYSVKEAAEYLQLTERQVQDIVALVR